MMQSCLHFKKDPENVIDLLTFIKLIIYEVAFRYFGIAPARRRRYSATTPFSTIVSERNGHPVQQ